MTYNILEPLIPLMAIAGIFLGLLFCVYMFYDRPRDPNKIPRKYRRRASSECIWKAVHDAKLLSHLPDRQHILLSIEEVRLDYGYVPHDLLDEINDERIKLSEQATIESAVDEAFKNEDAHVCTSCNLT